MAASAPAAQRFSLRRYVCDAIAAGGMATVHIGRLMGPVGFARTVAIKRLHAQYAHVIPRASPWRALVLLAAAFVGLAVLLVLARFLFGGSHVTSSGGAEPSSSATRSPAGAERPADTVNVAVPAASTLGARPEPQNSPSPSASSAPVTTSRPRVPTPPRRSPHPGQGSDPDLGY